MKFCEYIQKSLQDMGYDVVFGIPGYYIMPLWQTFKDSPRIVLARHESGAVFMADGWARVNGKPGVVMTTLGPGQTNMLTGVACAYKDSIPLLAITGQAKVDTFGRGAFQECYDVDRGFSPTSLFSPITKATFEITDIRNAVFLFERALKIAVTGRPGPVHLSIPYDIQEQEIPESEVKFDRNSYNIHKTVESNLVSSMSDTIDILTKSKRVMILAGWGCYLSGTVDELKLLSRKLSAPIVTTVKGLSAVAYDWEMFIGHIGLGQKKGIVNFLEEYNPDTILVLGSSLSAYYINQIKNIFNKAKCIQVDIVAEQIGLRRKVYMGVHSDLRVWMPEICKWLPNRENNEIKNKIQVFKNNSIEELSMAKGESDELQFMAHTIYELNRILPKNAVVIPDAGNHWLDTLSLYNTKSVCGFFTNSGLASMGHAIGASIGIKLAMPDKKVICISGDGSALMYGNEISVSAELGLDNVFIVFNNNSLGRVRTHQHFECNSTYIASDLTGVDFCMWAESMGAKGFKVQTMDEFSKAMSMALEYKGTSMIEVVVSKNEIPVCFK